MIWPFGGSGPFLDEETEAWHLDTWSWLLRNMGGMESLRRVPMVLPTTTFFPSTGTQGHARVEEVFDQVKAIAGLSDWPVTLEAQAERQPVRIIESVNMIPRGKPLPLGTFLARGNEAVISYDPGLIEDPVGLVATLAHELAHYLLSSFPSDPPGSHEMEEFATDLATCAMGFGLFGAVTSLRFEGGKDGWTLGWRGQGYLHPRDWAFTLAVFTMLRGEGLEPLKPWLRDTVYEETQQARRYLGRNASRLEPLASIETVQPKM